MGLVIGMDEAGYGPNLGPLVIGATCWEVPGDPRDFNLWGALAECVSEDGRDFPDRLQIADSKSVYSPSKGLKKLETGALAMLSSAAVACTRWSTLRKHLDGKSATTGDQPMWYSGFDPALPMHADPSIVSSFVGRLQACYERVGIRLVGVQCVIVEPREFNEALNEHNSKGVLLSTRSLSLLRRFWDPDRDEPTLTIADKHGGRNRYDVLLSEVLDGQMVFRIEEGREISRYRVGQTELWFRMRAEQFLPVAVASMVAKYVREISMDALNNFWRARIPELKPTKGYPMDARRFLNDIQEELPRAGIAMTDLWRNK